jgi:hypothetical protein
MTFLVTRFLSGPQKLTAALPVTLANLNIQVSINSRHCLALLDNFIRRWKYLSRLMQALSCIYHSSNCKYWSKQNVWESETFAYCSCDWAHQFCLLGSAVARVVQALRYKPEGCGFDSRRCHWNFPSTQACRPQYGPKVDSASNRNEYQEYFPGGRCVGLTTLPPSCFACLEIWNPQPPGTLRACRGILSRYIIVCNSSTIPVAN